MYDMQPPSHTLLSLTVMDRIIALSGISALPLGSWKRTGRSQGIVPFFLPLPPEAEGTGRKWAELGLVCQQAGPQALQVLWLSRPGPWLAPEGRGANTCKDQHSKRLGLFPPPPSFSDFITSHLPFTHQCESQGHSWSVCLAPQKPVWWTA